MTGLRFAMSYRPTTRLRLRLLRRRLGWWPWSRVCAWPAGSHNRSRTFRNAIWGDDLKLGRGSGNQFGARGFERSRRPDFDARPKRTFTHYARKSLARHRNNFYTKCEKLFAIVSPGRGLRVLMSEKLDWQDDIRRGFNRTIHTVEFGSITPESFGNFDLVVPLTIADLLRVRRSPSLLDKHPIPVPSERCILLCHDKYKFNQTLINAGFGRHIPKMGPGLAPPYILKKRTGEWGQGCRMIRDRVEEHAARKQLNDPAFFCQEIIRGPIEFATHILFAEGRIVKSLNIMYEFESETPIKGQDPDLYKIIHRCAYLDLFGSTLRAIGFQGLCSVNYKVAGGQPFLLEINPRFGGSLGPYFFSFIRHLNGSRRRVRQ